MNHKFSLTKRCDTLLAIVGSIAVTAPSDRHRPIPIAVPHDPLSLPVNSPCRPARPWQWTVPGGELSLIQNVPDPEPPCRWTIL